MAAYEALAAWAGVDGAWKEGDIVELSPKRARRLVEANILEPIGSDEELDDDDQDVDEPAAPKRRKRARAPVRKPPKERL